MAIHLLAALNDNSAAYVAFSAGSLAEVKAINNVQAACNAIRSASPYGRLISRLLYRRHWH